MRQQRPYPQLIVTRKAARALAAGHPWVYAGEVIGTAPAPVGGAMAANGCVVDVMEQNGTWQGAGLLSESSILRVRIVTRNANDRLDEAFWRRRIAWAWQHRTTTMGGRGTDGERDLEACRVVFGEADGMPGLVVDRYGRVLVAQVGTVGMEMLRPVLYPLLLDVLRDAGEDVRAIYERCDSTSRAKEGLEPRTGWWEAPEGATDGDGAVEPGALVIRENGVSYELDLAEGQKTGFFLDQKYNRRAVARIAVGRRVLDCFCHVGAFGLNAARGGASYVRCVDVSRSAIDLARRNARLNRYAVDDEGAGGSDEVGTMAGTSDLAAAAPGTIPARPVGRTAGGMPPAAAQPAPTMGFTCANAFDYLTSLRKDRGLLRAEGGPFDLIVLDPPAFTKSRATVRGAMRGYREINTEALRLLPRGGYLATCSCSHFMTTELLCEAIADAARAAGVRLKQVEQRQQAPDHPILWGFPQSHYLDFFIFQVV